MNESKLGPVMENGKKFRRGCSGVGHRCISVAAKVAAFRIGMTVMDLRAYEKSIANVNVEGSTPFTRFQERPNAERRWALFVCAISCLYLDLRSVWIFTFDLLVPLGKRTHSALQGRLLSRWAEGFLR